MYITNLCGRYSVSNQDLQNTENSIRLVVGTRKKPTIEKPKHYLLQKTGISFVYISSLYPTTIGEKATEKPVVYQFEYQGCKYLLSVLSDGTGAFIEYDSVRANSPFSNNIGELGVKIAPTPKVAGDTGKVGSHATV